MEVNKKTQIKITFVLLTILLLGTLTSCYGRTDVNDPGNGNGQEFDYDADPVVNTERVKRISGGFWPAPPGFGGNLLGAQVGDPGTYIYESLFFILVGTDEIIPRLAKEWVHEGNKTIITLHDNRKWSDGTDFTAKDMLTYYFVNINSSGINKHLEEVTAVDDYILEFVWAEPVVSDAQKMMFLSEGWQAVTPYHVFGDLADEIEEIMERGEDYTGESRSRRPPFGLVFNNDDERRLKEIFEEVKNVDMDLPIGTGPYMVDRITNVQCNLVVNPYYPDADKLEFQKLIMHTVADYNSLLSSNETDSFVGTLPYDMARTILDASGQMVMYPLLEQKSIGVIFNTDIQPLNDKRVRQALNELIDKKPVREVANYWGVENDVATTGLIPSTLDRYVSDEVNAKIQRYTGDVDKAAQMLEEAGWSRNKDGKWADETGRTFRFTVAANGGWGAQGISAANEIAEQLTSFGIDTEARAVEATVVVSNMKAGAYDMLIDYIDMTWNITDPYKAFSAYYGDISEKAGIDDLDSLVLQDYEGKDINVKEAVDSLLYINDEDEYEDLVGRLAWATNDNAIGINLYQNVMAIWENTSTQKGLPMEVEFDEYDRMMPLARNEQEYEDIAVLNRAYAPFAEVFVRNQVKPK
ncbi:MAG TPA: ABC transporter substrate-binding protein [Bacillota bacterium]|nr:ABC transporter substrate-binding protein [Bacillota bacterium]